jgi:hypothetical protein
VDRGFELSGRDLTPLEKNSVEIFLSTLTDYASEAVKDGQTVEEWIANTTESLMSGWPVLSLFLAATSLEGLVVSSQAAQPYGLVAQALQKVIDQLRPIAERGETEIYEKYNAW